MKHLHRWWAMPLALALWVAGPAWGADATSYPNQTVRIVIPVTPASTVDTVARLLAEGLRTALGQPFIVDNRPGAGQVTGTHAVARSAPDGHTLLVGTMSALVLQPHTNKLPYDTLRDLRVVALVGAIPLAVFAAADSPLKSVGDVIQAARAKPGALSYGSFGTASSSHLLGEYFARQVGAATVHVPYQGGAPVSRAILSGEIDFGILDVGTGASLVSAGRLKVLGIGGASRSVAFPGSPTFAEQGVQGMEPFAPWVAVLAPAGVPQPVVDRLSVEIMRTLDKPEVKTQLGGLGMNVTPLPAREAQAFVEEEMVRWKNILAQSLPGVKLE